ncbi:MAG: DNA gyrase subunit A [bacterium]
MKRKTAEEREDKSRIVPVELEGQMKDSYIDYAMSVIVGRALPDARDGLKPVHRRIVYAMHDMGLGPEKPYRKSAKVVGEVMGRFHPHGDAAIYDTLVRMAQDFTMRYTLIDGHGNFGSVDGDNPAAMRYTEVRLAPLASELVRDIRMDTVDFADNYDASEREPAVLPAPFPSLLVNGSAGIAVGMATNIPPHNLSEVIDGVVAMIDDPDCDPRKLMKFVKGPDFPTGGEILGRDGIREAYDTGRGKITLRGALGFEPLKGNRQSIVITELPYQVNKAAFIESVADLVKGKKLDGVSDIRDESDRDGMRIVIELRRDVNPHVISNCLIKHTQFQVSYGIIMLALHKTRPVLLNLSDAIKYFIEHRREVVRRRTTFELAKARERAHILEGLTEALKNIDAVIELIKKSRDVAAAKTGLMERFKLTEIQAQAILDMRLQKLTGIEKKAIMDEYTELIKKIGALEDVLASERKILQIIKEECGKIREEFGDKRKTRITAEEDEIDIEDLIQKEDVVVTVTRDGWVKRLPVGTYRLQARGGKGIIGAMTKAEDVVKHMFVSSSHDIILVFSNRGSVYRIKAYHIPQASRTAKGTPIVNLLQLSGSEKVAAVIPIGQFDEKRFLVMVTKNGIVKKTRLAAYDTPRKGGIRGIGLSLDDELRYVLLTDGEREIVLGTKKGLSIRFAEREVRPMGRAAAGVKGITLKREDEVVGAAVVQENCSLLVVCEKGFGKRTSLEYYRPQKRGGMGIKTIQASEKNGCVVGIEVVSLDEELLMISDRGILIRQPVKTVKSTVGRSTQGVRLMRIDPGDRIVAFETYLPSEENNHAADA